jgi:PrtD family type I secretion system ABC transporter
VECRPNILSWLHFADYRFDMPEIIMASIPLSHLDVGLSAALRRCRGRLVSVGGFSGLVNLLQLTTSVYMMQVFDRVLATRNMDTLYYLTALAIVATLVLSVLEAVRSQVMQRIGSWAERRVAPETFVRAIEAQLRGRPYRMEALRDLAVWRGYVGSPGALSLYDVPWVPIYLSVIFLLHPIMGCIALAGAVILFGLTLLAELITSDLLKKAGSAAMASQRSAESISRNAEVIDSMGMLPNVMENWRDTVDQAFLPQKGAANRSSLIIATTKFFRISIQIAILGVGAWLVVRQELTSGASIAASIIMGRALAPVEQMIGGWKQLVQARQAYRRLSTFLAMPRLRPEGMPMPRPEGKLSVERVSYAFPNHTVPTVKAVEFALEAGETMAVIGPTAAGKTTLVRLIIGTLAPSSGHVRLDGVDVFQWMREDFGKYVGYLPQDVELFDGSVLRNIARMSKTPDIEAAFEAAKIAGCHDMILRLPQGYDTDIGEAGLHLSGGQRQLVGLARAIYGKPRMVVLDEPNSNLDGESEAALSRGVMALKSAGTTVILVSHRPALVQCVDKVLVLRDGAVNMFGPRAEVLKRLMGPVGQGPRPVDHGSSAQPMGSFPLIATIPQIGNGGSS